MPGPTPPPPPTVSVAQPTASSAQAINTLAGTANHTTVMIVQILFLAFAAIALGCLLSYGVRHWMDARYAKSKPALSWLNWLYVPPLRVEDAVFALEADPEYEKSTRRPLPPPPTEGAN